MLSWFSKGNTVEVSDDMPSPEYRRRLEQVTGLRELSARYLPQSARDGIGLVMELVLEGLHQHSMVSKLQEGDRTAYRDMLKAMFDSMAGSDKE